MLASGLSKTQRSSYPRNQSTVVFCLDRISINTELYIWKGKDYALLCQEFGFYWFFLEVKDCYVGSMDTNLDFVDEINVGEDRISYRVGYRG